MLLGKKTLEKKDELINGQVYSVSKSSNAFYMYSVATGRVSSGPWRILK